MKMWKWILLLILVIGVILVASYLGAMLMSFAIKLVFGLLIGAIIWIAVKRLKGKLKGKS